MVIAGGVEDPTLRALRSGFGKQVKSLQSTSAAYGFGTAGRDAGGKLYLSPEQTKAMSGNNSQGPVYRTYEAIGPQPESKFQSAPAPGFGTSARSIKYQTPVPGPGTYATEGAIGQMKDSRRATEARAVFGTATRDQVAKVWLDDELMKINFGKETPGPSMYSKPGGLGRQTESQYSTSAAFRQGSSQRFNDKSNTRDFPGAGSYQSAYPAVGKQTLSNKVTLPAAKVGTSTRDGSKKIFISKEHEKQSFGENSPGPATGPVVHSFGPQTLSVKKTNPSMSFGTSKRDAGYANDTPGPGTYWA